MQACNCLFKINTADSAQPRNHSGVSNLWNGLWNGLMEWTGGMD